MTAPCPCGRTFSSVVGLGVHQARTGCDPDASRRRYLERQRRRPKRQVAADYFRAWRAEHPEYRERETIRGRVRRAVMDPIERRRDRGRRRRMPEPEPLPALHTGHAIFDQARRIVGGRSSTLTTLYDPLYDDLLSVAAVAILEGKDPSAAVRTFRAAERAWLRVTAPLLPELAAAR